MNSLLATFLVTLLTTQQVLGEEHNNFGAQVVAQFPEGVWNSDCRPESLRRLPEKCYNRINSNSTMAEKLACSLLQAPGSERMVPLGLFPTNIPLGIDILTLSSDALTPLYQECALERMIDDGCVTFTRNVWGGEHTSDTYTTSSEYTSAMQESFGIDASVSAGFGPVSISTSINKKNEQASSVHNSRSVAGFSQVWRNSVGTISLGECAKKYMNTNISNDWKLAVEKSEIKTPFEMAVDKDFAKLAEKGFYYPVSFGFAVQYRGEIIATYDSAEKSSSSSMSEAISVGVEASFLGATAGASTTVGEAISKSASGKSVNAKVSNFVSTNGECDFPAMLENGGADWSNLLSSCAQKTADNIENLPRASHIPRGGFASLTEHLAEQGIDITTPKIEFALQIYHGYCTLIPGSSVFDSDLETHTTKYTCHLADGRQLYEREDTMSWNVGQEAGAARPHFTKRSWPLIRDTYWQGDLSTQQKLIETYCGYGCFKHSHNLRS